MDAETAVHSKHILIIEDDHAISEMVCTALEGVGFQAHTAADVVEAESRISQQMPDCILLDWMLPGVSGIEFARRLKREESTRDVPVIMLTAKSAEYDRLAGFAAGIDDYVAKPFSIRELMARIRAVLRRSSPVGDDRPIELDGLRLDPLSHRVTGTGKSVKLGPTEFRMLHFFMGNQERVFTRSQLLDRVWGTNVYVEERTVDVHIRRLRKALAPHGFDRFVQTVHGTGYRFSRHSS